tara:strand:+ start:220 stop:483 length:264 start_codon:yes stop_codon:yes gene_type:complete
MLFEQRIKGGFGPLFFSLINTNMKYLIFLLTLFLYSCSYKADIDIWDRFMDRIDNFKSKDKVSESDQKLIQEATEKEWQDVDKLTDK